ncbi:hypothetical protein CCP2SC5_240021 [Azospirillaceae bacterium]
MGIESLAKELEVFAKNGSSAMLSGLSNRLPILLEQTLKQIVGKPPLNYSVPRSPSFSLWRIAKCIM